MPLTSAAVTEGPRLASHSAGDSCVLVVEDHPDLRDMFTALLEAEGFHVQAARNGLEALAALHHAKPCVILLDLMMPVMNGQEFRRLQLADPASRDVPIICMTAEHDGLVRAEQLRAARFFPKPVDLYALVEAVRAIATTTG